MAGLDGDAALSESKGAEPGVGGLSEKPTAPHEGEEEEPLAEDAEVDETTG